MGLPEVVFLENNPRCVRARVRARARARVLEWFPHRFDGDLVRERVVGVARRVHGPVHRAEIARPNVLRQLDRVPGKLLRDPHLRNVRKKTTAKAEGKLVSVQQFVVQQFGGLGNKLSVLGA